uniref:MFAP1 domain-containing protein n=1 Tax=Caenorhabditis japonica TaxID=281687 RepID=A0A8R1HZV5_CAEJA
MGDYVPSFEQRESDARSFGHSRLPTLGAIPVKNEKGQTVMQKVKVSRYVAGKAPDYARNYESESSESKSDEEIDDRRHGRERDRDRRERSDSEDEERRRRRRRDAERRRDQRYVEKPEVLGRESEGDDEDVVKRESDEDEEKQEERRERARMRRLELNERNREEHESDDGEEDEEEFERRRRVIREKALKREDDIKREIKHEEYEEDVEEEQEEESSEEEDSDEDDDPVPRLKPIFTRKKDRITLMEAEKEKEKELQRQIEEEKRAEERKRESAKLVEKVLQEEEDAEKRKTEDRVDLTSVLTDDETENMAYEAWKLREMKRLKRDRDERETAAKEKAELDKIHAMTEEERLKYLRANPKIVTNKQDKGKYKFLQKYFHRGAFFLDEEDEVLKRNFAEATNDDQFDKTILPKVMQVKNFGKASRTKYTHLTEEDTTDHQGVWASTNQLNTQFYSKRAAGARPVFERPPTKKKK